MNSEWNEISSQEDISSIDLRSTSIIFKHSIRCSTSALVLNRLQRGWDNNEVNPDNVFYLDLINHRDLSNEISSKYGVQHESPQILIIKKGKCVFSASHFEIDFKVIKNKVKEIEDISAKVS